MPIGHRIIDEIVKQGMVRPDTVEPSLLIWNGNAADQIDALIAERFGAVGEIFLRCPLTGEDLYPASDMEDHGDGSYSFVVRGEDGEPKWRHTIRTEEV